LPTLLSNTVGPDSSQLLVIFRPYCVTLSRRRDVPSLSVSDRSSLCRPLISCDVSSDRKRKNHRVTYLMLSCRDYWRLTS